ncbi:MAG: hypothetical protein IJ960_00810 [Oscillospiraceae bacterium]|nr:hypothetical protein [Oscillospiraceae bacterium]
MIDNHHYSVYHRGTDRPIMIHGTAAECARAMGVLVASFRSFWCRQRRGRPNACRKWEIIREED